MPIQLPPQHQQSLRLHRRTWLQRVWRLAAGGALGGVGSLAATIASDARAVPIFSSPASASAPASSSSSRRLVLRFAFSRSADDPRTQWLIAVYRELLDRLGVGFEFVDVPPGRAPLQVEAGQVDGELGRTWDYGQLHPTMVRVSEPNNAVEFAVYAASPAPGARFPGWARVRAEGLDCEHRRGIQEMAQMLGKELEAKHVSSVTTIEQGVRRLQLGRTALYFDVREAVEDFFSLGGASREALAGPPVRLLDVVQTTTGHAYLHQRHAALVPAIARELRAMKAEGLVDRYRQQALDRYLAAHPR